MRVLHLSFHFAEYAISLSRALAKDHEVLLVLGRENAAAELIDRAIAGNPASLQVMTLRDYPLKDPRSAGNAIRLLQVIRRFQPDVVHCQEAHRDYLAAVLPVLRRYPLILTIHDHKPHSGNDMRVRNRMEIYRRWLRKWADIVIVHGDAIQKETEELAPGIKGRVLSIPHGPLGQGADLGRVGHPDWEPGHLLFFGRIEKYKGLGYALDAMDILHSKGRLVHLTIAGRGSDLEPYRKRIQSNPSCTLREQFVPAGDIAELFRRSHIVVMPYTDATQSGVAAMALNYGRPVIATNVGSVADMVHHEQTGLIVPAMDSAALADAIERLLDNAELAARFALAAVQMAQWDLSWDIIARQTTSAYRHAIRHHDSTT